MHKFKLSRPPIHNGFHHPLSSVSLKTLITLSLILIYSEIFEAGASSTSKNLVNLHHASSENLNLSAGATATAAASGSNQFQNEYQYRQSATKPASVSADRHKSSTPEPLPASTTITTTLSDNQPSSDLSNFGGLDYSLGDIRLMTNVPDCRGRLRLNASRGSITDGIGHYPVNTQCTWLIDSGSDNATVRIRIHQFNTECNYDFLYIFDGDSIYSPLVAALSGDMKDFSNSLAGRQSDEPISENRATLLATASGDHSSMSDSANVESAQASRTTPSTASPTAPENPTLELEAHSGKAFIYFHSDTAQSMPGFSLTYSVNSCPLDCSGRGDCDHSTMECRCSPGYYGSGCQYSRCPNNCTSPAHGFCDRGLSCVCNKAYRGPDCSLTSEQQSWTRLSSGIGAQVNTSIPARAFHQSIIVDDTMWVLGGKSQSSSNTNMGIFRNERTPTILAYDLVAHTWKDDIVYGVTNQDHLAELSGHSVAVHGNKIFIYGGMSMNNSILNTLSVFDTKTRSLLTIPGRKSEHSKEELVAPISVTGHSANIIDGFMFIFMGYNPLYGHLNFVQKFSLGNNSWSIIERQGSSVSGCIGHTSTFDPIARLVYIYGGHTVALKSNKLYSFNPQTEIWTYLQPGPSPRYYHSAIIMNGLLVILGGNSYNTSHRSDQCFQQTHLTYELGCSQATAKDVGENTTTISPVSCSKRCWSTLEDTSEGIFKRHGYTVVSSGNNGELLLFGGFNAVLMNDLRSLKVPQCSNFTSESECDKPKLGASCYWNKFNSSCEPREQSLFLTTSESDVSCSRSDIRSQQLACQARETCSDCLHTNLDCVWCGHSCQYNKCKSFTSKTVSEPSQCYRMEPPIENIIFNGTVSEWIRLKEAGRKVVAGEPDNEIDCKLDNCYLCQSRPQCSWQNEACLYTAQSALHSAMSPNSMIPNEELTDSNDSVIADSSSSPQSYRPNGSNSSLRMLMQRVDPFNRPFFGASSQGGMAASSPCDVPCYERRSCQACATSRCIWLSFTEQCIESSAYFAYQATGQCAMHYVAHLLKCSTATCSEIESCDKCLTNPKCGWLNDIDSNSGKGKCLEGNNTGPSLSSSSGLNLNLTELSAGSSSSTALVTRDGTSASLPNWFYTSCPACQCNGHSTCKKNSGICMQPCQDFTEGEHCERCIHGYFGDPINGGTCRPCRCNGHANSCSRDTGKCYCSTKGIVGHNCNRCDDKNYYIGDPSGPNGTCYYNLTTDYQYTFNMSKPEDHFYDEINFINIPLRKDSDIDFSIACSRLALMNISSGTSYKTRRTLHTNLECGSFRLRFLHDRLPFSDANYSFFVHVYRFQTPFILQIAFSQHRTLYLPQFFFTVSSTFLFFFALSGVLWKLKHEYDLYVRRQRQFIEMEQMASRPFSTILLELFRPPSGPAKNASTSGLKSHPKQQQGEPTPISFEPCFSSNVGVVSFVVQLPGKPGLAIGSSLVELSSSSNSMAHLNEDLDDDSCARHGNQSSKIMAEKLNET